MLSAILLIINYSKKERLRFIGKLPVNGIEKIQINIYQENEYDSSTGLYYSIENDKEFLLKKISFLIGSHDYIENLNDFSARSYDSIIFLTFIGEKDVYMIFDLKNRFVNNESNWQETQNSNDSLFLILKSIDTSLKYLGK